MIGVGTFELGVGLLVAVLIDYFAFRDRASTVGLVLLVIMLTQIVGFVVAVLESYVFYALVANLQETAPYLFVSDPAS
jgi:hypothetical protein